MLSMSKFSRAVWAALVLVLAPLPAQADVTLIDDSSLEFLIKTGLSSDTMLNASGAANEANFGQLVAATTTFGGTVQSMPSDMFDGYAGLAISFDGAVPAVAPTVADPHYNQAGAATLDAGCSNHQLLFPPQMLTDGSATLEVSRKVFVPANDSFIRWLNLVRNPGSNPVTFHLGLASDLGSDNETRITASSSGDLIADLTDTWVATMENYDMTGVSSDPRIGHVLQGEGSLAAPLASLRIVDGSARLFFWYTVTLPAGATRAILTFATGQPNKTAAADQAASLASLENVHALDCLSTQDKKQIANFRVPCTQPGDVGTACNDNDLCTLDDVCTSNGECAGQPKACRADASDCTGICNPSNGQCEESDVANGTTCFNGNACDGSDTCQAGACTPSGVVPNCNDHNPCTTDSCVIATGCANVLKAGCLACGSGEDAGADDDAGVVYAACDDGNKCNGVESCGADDTCQAGAALPCDDGDPCTADGCSPAIGCEHDEIASCMACDDDADCNDGNQCDGQEVCVRGICEDAKSLLDCDDHDDCTADECVAKDGCVHTRLSIGRCAASGSGGSGVKPTAGAAGGVPEDAGADDASVDGSVVIDDDDDGCDCSTTGAGRETSAVLWLLVLAWIGRRRSRTFI